MNRIYEITSITVNTYIKSIGKTQIALIAITLEIIFATQDEFEIVQFVWHYAIRLGERLGGDRYPQT